MSLLEWGWSFYRSETPNGLSGRIVRVIAAHGEQFLVVGDSGPCSATASGRLLFESGLPVVGDWATIENNRLERILPRRSSLSRIAPGGAHQVQTLAANVDLLFIVTGLDGDFNVRRLERYLLLALESRVTPVFVLTKSDLCPDPDGMETLARRIVGEWRIILSSSLDGRGAECMRTAIAPGQTAALIGSSGAGKSTLMNLLLGAARQETNDVRASDSRGRHTTTHRQMFRIPGGGLLIDQPGLREIQLRLEPAVLNQAFPELAEAAAGCRFRDCRHQTEPGCAVRRQIESGDLDPARLRSFNKLQREADRADEEFDAVARTKRKNMIKSIHRAMRGHYRD